MSKEYVTKEKVIETILSYGIGWGSARVRGVINNIPADDVVEVVHGMWINAYPDIEPNPMFMYGICSQCGFEQSISDTLNYCPNCGAKMDGGQHE